VYTTVHNIIIVLPIQHRTVLIIFPLILQTIIIAQMLSNGGQEKMTKLKREKGTIIPVALVWRTLTDISYDYMPKAYTVFVRNHFTGITPVNQNRLGRNTTGRYRVTWYAPLQTFGTLRQTGVKWRRKKCILRMFLSAKQLIILPTSRRSISVKFEM